MKFNNNKQRIIFENNHASKVICDFHNYVERMNYEFEGNEQFRGILEAIEKWQSDMESQEVHKIQELSKSQAKKYDLEPSKKNQLPRIAYVFENKYGSIIKVYAESIDQAKQIMKFGKYEGYKPSYRTTSQGDIAVTSYYPTNSPESEDLEMVQRLTKVKEAPYVKVENDPEFVESKKWTL